MIVLFSIPLRGSGILTTGYKIRLNCRRAILPMFHQNFARHPGNDIVRRTVSHSSCLLRYLLRLIIVLSALAPQVSGAKESDKSSSATHETSSSSASTQAQAQCLITGDGYLKARLEGAIQSEIDWHNNTMKCAGSVRPSGGLRLRFSHAVRGDKHPLVLLFGIHAIHEGESGKVLAVNVTIMREGKGEFYSTQGDKCIIDQLQQSVVPGMPTRKRSYRVEAHGFCNQPARALNGEGVVLITRFDFAGRIDVDADSDDDSLAMSTHS